MMCRSVGSVDQIQFNLLLFYEVTINLDIFGVIMKNWIPSNAYCNLISHRRLMEYSHGRSILRVIVLVT